MASTFTGSKGCLLGSAPALRGLIPSPVEFASSTGVNTRSMTKLSNALGGSRLNTARRSASNSPSLSTRTDGNFPASSGSLPRIEEP